MEAKSDKKPFVLLDENKTPFFLLIYCFLGSEKGFASEMSVLLIKTYGSKQGKPRGMKVFKAYDGQITLKKNQKSRFKGLCHIFPRNVVRISGNSIVSQFFHGIQLQPPHLRGIII